MFQLARRPQLKAAPPQSPLPHKLKPPTPPASQMPSLFTGSPKQKKGCSDCEAAKKPTLEQPPSDTQMRRGSPSEDPAERQADELGKRIGDDLSGTESVGHGPLPTSVQQVAESHLGVSLEGVHLDAGSGGQRKAKDESALAVTEGKRVAFGEGQLSTSSAEGRALLGHELVHVGQQASGHSVQQRAEKPASSSLGDLIKDENFAGAFRLINGLAMPQLLTTLEHASSVTLWAHFDAAVGVNRPRLAVAFATVMFRQAPLDLPGWPILPADQKRAVWSFLRKTPLQVLVATCGAGRINEVEDVLEPLPMVDLLRLLAMLRARNDGASCVTLLGTSASDRIAVAAMTADSHTLPPAAAGRAARLSPEDRAALLGSHVYIADDSAKCDGVIGARRGAQCFDLDAAFATAVASIRSPAIAHRLAVALAAVRTKYGVRPNSVGALEPTVRGDLLRVAGWNWVILAMPMPNAESEHGAALIKLPSQPYFVSQAHVADVIRHELIHAVDVNDALLHEAMKNAGLW